eukprot:TRINITY_DN467_c0_g1_i1.p1 TRINITY_DN467_c0_g1~~TRINITY_DN467_c0_g1_i1.p1  ORF type:complete len:482 (-),score=56.32 TRINITY_DN467_c0_g1_i1:199-1644(-)
MALILICALLSLIGILYHYYERKGLPLGPMSLPLIGSLPFLPHGGSKGFLDFSLANKYGKIVRVDLFTTKLFIINDFQLAKELFNRDDMAGRPQHFYTQHIKGYDGHSLGIIHSEGYSWQTQRRFSLMKLKNLGFGKKTLESTIYEEVKYLFDIIENEKEPSGEILMSELFNGPIVNVIWQIIASTRCDHNNEQDRKILDGISSLLKGSYDPRFFVPALSWFVPYSEVDLASFDLKRRVEKLIEEHEESLDENAPNDFIDNYLIEMRLGKDPTFTKQQLVVTCMDLFIAGSETSSTTLIWMVFFMIFHEDVQDKCFQEIKEVLGYTFPPREEDMASLPFCMATLKEIQRMGNTAPRSIFHVNLEDIEVEGYKIPKGNYFTANLRKFHFDPNVFEDPETFKPTRFYNKKLDPQFVPFGFGKRVCMGISMAKKELYYFFIMFIQRYRLSPSSVHGLPDPKNIQVGLTACPRPFYVNMSKRISS